MSSVQDFAAQAVTATLGRSTDVDACCALVSEVDRLLEDAARHLQDSGASLACRAGCNFCCHLRVMVLPHEAIALFRYLQSRMPADKAQRVRDALRQRARNPQQPPRRCAFLVEGACAAYEVRPGACAAFHSTSREPCEQSFLDPAAPAGVMALQALRAVALALEAGVREELHAQGLSDVPAELHTAVTALLAEPALIGRWRAGRSLFRPAHSSQESE